MPSSPAPSRPWGRSVTLPCFSVWSEVGYTLLGFWSAFPRRLPRSSLLFVLRDHLTERLSGAETELRLRNVAGGTASPGTWVLPVPPPPCLEVVLAGAWCVLPTPSSFACTRLPRGHGHRGHSPGRRKGAPLPLRRDLSAVSLGPYGAWDAGSCRPVRGSVWEAAVLSGSLMSTARRGGSGS